MRAQPLHARCPLGPWHLSKDNMKGDPEIIRVLGDVLAAELTAINQYFLHAKMCQNWGYGKLAAYKRHESIEEMRDAEAVMDRILYFDGVPNMQRMNPVKIGEDPVEQHRADLALEVDAIDRLNQAITLCRSKGDNGTAEILEHILKGEEQSVDWLEAQLHVVQDIGRERYLAEQLG
jgi:bacterioferritin